MMNDLMLRAGMILADATGVTGVDGTGTAPGAPDVGKTVKTVTDTDLWKNVVGPVGIALGIVILIFGVYKFVTQVAGGQAPRAGKTAVGTIFAVAILFNPTILFSLVNVAGRVVTTAIDAVTSVIGG